VTTNAKVLELKARAFFDRDIPIIPNGVDTDHFKPMDNINQLLKTLRLTTLDSSGYPHQLGPQQAPPLHERVVGFAGELREKKGIRILMPAFAQVNKTGPATLLIVGSVRQGADKEFFNEFLISNPGLQIIVAGYIPFQELPSYYSLMDVFVHPSLRDGMPNAVLEAMSCGRSVVATPVGGIKDVLEDGKNGTIVNVNDPNALAEKILELLDDPEKRNFLGKNARESVLSKYTMENELKANIQVYRKLGLNI